MVDASQGDRQAVDGGVASIFPKGSPVGLLTVEAVARICHEANRGLCVWLGDFSQFEWDLAPVWQRLSAVNGVRFLLENPDAPPDVLHRCWMQEKVLAGWVYGPVKDAEAKTHPCLLPFEELPMGQQRKDVLFMQIVESLRPLVVPDWPA